MSRATFTSQHLAAAFAVLCRNCRPRTSATLWVSNVTLWVPAAEYSYIRSHTGDQGTNFTIDLVGGQAMQFNNVVDMRAEGVYVGQYK
jgi:hypothetical protein